MRLGRTDVDRTERGSVLAEAALVLPVVIMLMLGSADLGLWVFATTEAASSARDGARAGTLSYLQADVAGSSDAIAIADAVRRRLGGEAVTITINCVGPGDTTPLAGGCATASVINPDRVQVTVSWTRSGLSYLTARFGATQTVSATAVMSVTGLPTVVAAP